MASGFISVTTSLQYGGTGSYQLNMTIPNISMVTTSSYTITGPDANGYGTFTPTVAGAFILQASDGTTRYISDDITCWAYVTPSFTSISHSVISSSETTSGQFHGQGIFLNYSAGSGNHRANASKFNITYTLGSGSSEITGVSGTIAGTFSGIDVSYSTTSYGSKKRTINVSVSSNVDYYRLTSTSTSASVTVTVSAPPTPSVSYDVTPPSNFINQTYNINASAVPITRTVTWTEGSSSYYSQGGTKSASAIGTYTITFTLTSPSSHRWTDRSSDNTKSFTWKVLDPYIGYSRPQINGEDYEAIIFENGEAKLVVFKVGDT